MRFALFLTVFVIFCVTVQSAKAQLDAAFPSSSVNYKVISDDPKDLNHLWIHIQPITIDGGQMNLAVGSGLGITYLPKPNIELQGGIRGNLINALDFQRFSSGQGATITWQESKREQSEMKLTNVFSRFYQWQVGGTYYFNDIEKTGGSKIILNENAIPGNTSFPENIEVDAKIRQLMGVRFGLSSMATTVSLNRAIEDQDISIQGDKGTTINAKGTQSGNGFSTSGNSNSIFSSFYSTGFNLGFALQRIKNISIKTDRQGILSNNSIITFYGDILFNPWTRLDAIETRWKNSGTAENFSTNAIKLSKLGGKVGAEIRYNQASFISLGAEIGYQPSIQGEGWFGVLKLCMPTFSFGATRSKVASNIGKNQSLTQ